MPMIGNKRNETICYCCMTKTDNFKHFGNGSYRERYCISCNEKYTAKERKEREIKNVLGALSNIDINGL